MITNTDETTLFADILTPILVQVPGCPTALVEQAIKQAATEFYEQTWCWRQRLPEVVASDSDVQILTPPAGTAAIALVCLEHKGRLPRYDFWPPRAIKFAEELKEHQTFVPIAVLKPSNDAVAVPSGHPALWQDAWEQGALWRLRIQAGQPWYNPQEAARNELLFHQAKIAERQKQSTGNTGRSITVTPYSFM